MAYLTPLLSKFSLPKQFTETSHTAGAYFKDVENYHAFGERM
jgi:hypothetical protein